MFPVFRVLSVFPVFSVASLFSVASVFSVAGNLFRPGVPNQYKDGGACRLRCYHGRRVDCEANSLDYLD